MFANGKAVTTKVSNSKECYCLVNVTYGRAKYGDADPYSEFVRCIYPSTVHTHSREHTHTVNTHTQISGQ